MDADVVDRALDNNRSISTEGGKVYFAGLFVG
jgi:hypothetical protein